MITEKQITTEILGEIKKSVDISAKEGGRYKIYFLKNGNVAYIRYSNIRYTTSRPHGIYYFVVSIDKFREYKERFRLILSCGSSDRTLIIPSRDIEELFKNVGISDNKWHFYVSTDMMLKDIDLSKYLNKWELLNKNEIISEENMEDRIREADLRAKIFANIYKLSKENKKCNHIYLCNDLYYAGFQKYEILATLKYLEEKGTIYKIVYVDWYIKERYRDSEPEENDALLVDIFTIIKDFARKHDWSYGLKRSDLYDKLYKKGYTEDDIHEGLKLLEERKIIYKKSFIYWFTYDYTGDVIKGDIVKDNQDAIYMPDKLPESEIEIIKELKSEDIKIADLTENEYSDVPSKVEFLTKRWKELKEEKEKMEYAKQNEVDFQKELERKRDESINRQKELEIKILEIDKEKQILEKLFEPIRQEYEQKNQKVVEEKKVLIA